jgi:hypothetical protein
MPIFKRTTQKRFYIAICLILFLGIISLIIEMFLPKLLNFLINNNQTIDLICNITQGLLWIATLLFYFWKNLHKTEKSTPDPPISNTINIGGTVNKSKIIFGNNNEVQNNGD